MVLLAALLDGTVPSVPWVGSKDGLPYLIAHLKGSLKRVIPLFSERDANLVALSFSNVETNQGLN